MFATWQIPPFEFPPGRVFQKQPTLRRPILTVPSQYAGRGWMGHFLSHQGTPADWLRVRPPPPPCRCSQRWAPACFHKASIKAEGKGFEPSTPFGASDFESDRWPIRIPSGSGGNDRASGAAAQDCLQARLPRQPASRYHRYRPLPTKKLLRILSTRQSLPVLAVAAGRLKDDFGNAIVRQSQARMTRIRTDGPDGRV